jgi:hypothetical protein
MDSKMRRRRLLVALGWAAPVGVGSVVGVVARLPETMPVGAVIAVAVLIAALIVPILLTSVLVVLDSPGMTERLCRVIDAWRRTPDPKTERQRSRGSAPAPGRRPPRAGDKAEAAKVKKRSTREP